MTEGIVIERKTAGQEPPPGVNGSGNAPETTTQSGAIPPNAQTDTGTAASPSEGGKAPETNAATTMSATEVEKAQQSAGIATNGGDLDTSPKGTGEKAERMKSLEREVSPGTMPDGSHATTSGDRGESYEPSTMNKLKNKLHIGGGKK